MWWAILNALEMKNKENIYLFKFSLNFYTIFILKL
jgi:hypothetical protein